MAEYVLMPCYQPWKTLLEWEMGGVLAIRGRTWCSYSFKGVWPKKKKKEKWLRIFVVQRSCLGEVGQAFVSVLAVLLLLLQNDQWADNVFWC